MLPSGLVVMGEDSQFSGHELESKHLILDGNFFYRNLLFKSLFCCLKKT